MRAVLVLPLLLGCHETPPPPLLVGNCTVSPGTTVVARQVAYGCGQNDAVPPNCLQGGLTLATSAPNDLRLFAVEQTGRIRILDHEGLVAAPFLDITTDAGGPVLAGGEQGLLGLAFHPKFATNKQFFVAYTAEHRGAGMPFENVVARYTASATDPNVADPASGQVILSIPDPYSNHNGGMIEFGSDGFLYIANGDGGSGGDPENRGQNPDELLGKILRIDVDHPDGGKPYGIPAGNPYKAGGGAPEVFISGVRNPWRWSFDRATGDMWIGDVGQGEVEEIDVLAPSEQAGKNLGWSMYEGDTCFKAPCTPDAMGFPQDKRTHASGWTAIIGGQVYRGGCYPDLVGWYFYTDNGHGGLVKAHLEPDRTLEIVDLPGSFPKSPSSLHADAAGELYETDTNGNLFHIEVSATP